MQTCFVVWFCASSKIFVNGSDITAGRERLKIFVSITKSGKTKRVVYWSPRGQKKPGMFKSLSIIYYNRSASSRSFEGLRNLVLIYRLAQQGTDASYLW